MPESAPNAEPPPRYAVTLRVRGLGAEAGVPPLGPFDLDLCAAEAVSLVGPSGAGKSRLLRALADLDPSVGDVVLAGRSRESFSGPHWRKRVVYVPAESGWWLDRVGDHFDNPAIGAEIARRLGFAADALDWEVARLSTGERQRLALARALALEPTILLLDEPTSGLDAETAAIVEKELRLHIAAGTGALIVTHDRAQAERLAQRHLTLASGRLEGETTRDEEDEAAP